MIERMDDSPPGVVGLRASGKLTRDDYREVLQPALKEAVESGEARVLFVLPDFDGLETGAWIEEVKTGLRGEFTDRSAWQRPASVTGCALVAQPMCMCAWAMGMFGWAMPGERGVYEMDDLDEARPWVAA